MSNSEQIEYWNGDAGASWAAEADALDRMLHEVGTAALTRAALRPGNRVLDVGCGSGALTIAAQELVGRDGCAIGLDISQPLILNAQRRAVTRNSAARFIQADAATWRDRHDFDAVISRFGVMFFDDPRAAFANLARLTKTDCKLTFACWRSPKENDLGSGLMKAAGHLFVMPDTKPDPTAPGPFALADRTRLNQILIDAGWRDVCFETWDGRLPLPGANVRDCAASLARLGAIARLIREQQVAVERVVDTLVPFLEQRHENGQYALDGAAWIVSAKR